MGHGRGGEEGKEGLLMVILRERYQRATPGLYSIADDRRRTPANSTTDIDKHVLSDIGHTMVSFIDNLYMPLT